MASPRHQLKKERLLRRHEAEDSVPEPDHTCDVCGFAAKTARGLSSHERSHKEE